MKKIALALVLAVVSGAAMPEWVVAIDDKNDTMYIDPATKRHSGSMVKMWVMSDYKSPQPTESGKSFLSITDQAEFDCDTEQYRFRYTWWHSGNMGNGSVVESDDSPQEWRPVLPKSDAETFWINACGRSTAYRKTL